jgi:plastocyanin
MHMPRSILVLALLPFCLLVACGDASAPVTPSNGTNGGDGAPPSANVTMVSAGDGYGDYTHSFNPASVTVRTGGTVTWVNGSGELHNVTFAPAQGVPANIGDHASGSNARTFQAVGTFSYQCTNHVGMTGSVVVQSGG